MFIFQVVTGDWFWNSIQFQAAASVNMYKWREAGCMSPAANKSVFSPPTPSSGGTSRLLYVRNSAATLIELCHALDHRYFVSFLKKKNCAFFFIVTYLFFLQVANY